MNNNWVKLNRKLLSSSYFKRDHEKVYFWVYLLMKANWEPKKEILGGKPVICNPGQFTTGRRQIAEETGINESKVERLLTFFEKTAQQIEQQKTNTNRLITIINWSKYQDNEQPNGQRSNNDRTTDEQQVNTPKEYTEVLRSIEKENYIKEKFSIHLDPDKEREIEEFNERLLNNPDYD